MAFKKFGPVPYPPLLVVERDDPIDDDWLAGKLASAPDGLSLLIRTAAGANNRGGFFFHLTLSADDVSFCDFAGDRIILLPLAQAVRLINHASGRAFDEEMLTLCQRSVNLRQDA